jgi:protein ImuB
MARIPSGRLRPRIACVDVPELPLQLLLRRHPDWSRLPVAVVAEDKPQAAILWSNEAARRARILPGLRYAAALSLAGDLRADVVPEAELRRAKALLLRRLRGFTPEVEPATAEPGVFWLDAAGLMLLYPSLQAWAEKICASLCRSGFSANVAVGFTRFGSYATVKARAGVVVFDEAADETRAAGRVALGRLALEPRLLAGLEQLGIRTVAELLRLPPEGVLQRFGGEAYRLHTLASGDLQLPLQPLASDEPLARTQQFEPPETDWTRLLFHVKRLLHPLLELLAVRCEALAEVGLHLELDGAPARSERLRPAAPTLDALVLLELVRLRLEALRAPAPVLGLTLAVRGSAATREQLRLFEQAPRRDLEAAGRALARLRAELGEASVVRARLREAHLPEASFTWEPLERLAAPMPAAGGARQLVRRLNVPPLPLPGAPQGRIDGPYVVSGGWWGREVQREYHFVETSSGELWWVFHDRRRRRWFLHAQIE